MLDALACLKAEERSTISAISEQMRTIIESIPMPEDVAAEIAAFLTPFDEKDAYAVRSSARRRICQPPPLQASRTPI